MPSPRRYLMCRPEHFEVSYAINPWMDITAGVDRELAVQQWEALRQTYLDLGHDVEVIDPVPGLPDMVFAANGGLVVEGRRSAPGSPTPSAAPRPGLPGRLATLGLKDVTEPVHVNEGEGDFLVVGHLVLAGTGFRTDPGAHTEVQELFGIPVIPAAGGPALLPPGHGAGRPRRRHRRLLPGGVQPGQPGVLQRLFPDAILAAEADAVVLGLNAVSDGRNVVLPSAATDLADQLRERGYVPIGVDLRAAQGRRQRPVLHAGDPQLTSLLEVGAPEVAFLVGQRLVSVDVEDDEDRVQPDGEHAVLDELLTHREGLRADPGHPAARTADPPPGSWRR